MSDVMWTPLYCAVMSRIWNEWK